MTDRKSFWKRALVTIVAIAVLYPLGLAQGGVVVHTNDVLFTHSPDYHGVNYSAFWDDDQGSIGSREALRRAGVQLMRFPGGASGDWYDWQDPYRISTTSPLDLSNYAKAVGARVLFQTNWEGNECDNSGAHMADWVSHANDNSMDVAL